jgi:hypothetical protein
VDATTVASFSDISVKTNQLNTLFRVVPTTLTNIVASVSTTITAGTQAGLVLCLDSISSPANCLVVYHDGTSLKVDQLLAGTWSNLATWTAT